MPFFTRASGGIVVWIRTQTFATITAADDLRRSHYTEVMKKFHVAIATDNISASVQEYTLRLGSAPCVFVDNAYALWRTETINMSVLQDSSCTPGELRYLGWEDPEALEFTSSTDVNNIVWENFSAEQQAEEIEEMWPGTGYMPSNDF